MRVWSRRLTPLALVAYAAYAVIWQREPAAEPLTTYPEASADTVFLRILAKDEVARDVIAGRRSLIEAAAMFRELNRVPPAVPAHVRLEGSRESLADRSDEECLCQQVIWWTGSTNLRAEFSGRAEATERLLTNLLRAETQCRPTIELPDSPLMESATDFLERFRGALADTRRGRRGS
jgi:hypothetical protein